MSVSFGLTIPQRGAFIGVGTIGELIALGPLAEESGLFDSVWVGDSLIAKPRPESISILGALAAITETVTLGVGCMASFTVRDPVTFAYQWATLDQLSEGRMLLATCTGIVPQGGKSAREGQHFGGVKDADRPSIMEENMRLCRALWSGEPIDFDGTFRSYEGLQVQPTPVQDPCPIWISANPNPGKYFARSMKRVATLGDGFQTVVLTPDRLRSMTTELRTHLLDAGRDPDSFPVMAYHNINIGADRDECLEESKRFLDAYYGPVFSMEVVESWTAAGTPEQCVDHLANLIDQGANAITLRCTSFDQLSQIERLTTEVLPAFG